MEKEEDKGILDACFLIWMRLMEENGKGKQPSPSETLNEPRPEHPEGAV